MELYDDLRKTAAERAVSLADFKSSGGKIIEYISNFVPEELIYAAGAKPYLMCRGGEPEPPDAVLEDMLRFTNPLCRSICGLIKLGLDPVTPMTDLIAVSQHDCHVARTAEYLELMDLPVHKVGVPNDWERDFAREYYFDELKDLKSKIEAITGQTATDERLRYYIGLYNEMHALLRDISKLRKEDAPVLGGVDFIKLNHYTFFADPEYAVEQLRKIYDGLKSAPAKFSSGTPRILLIGRGVAVGDYIAINRVEELGAVIVNEMLEDGIQWYQWDMPEEEDPLRSIWKQRYIDKLPLDIFQPSWGYRMEAMDELIREYRIDGVIWYQLLYDEIWDLEYSCVAKHCGENDVPMLRIETSYEYTREAMLPLNTRIESFVQLLKSRKKEGR